jgi:predicted TIM-barrel fold metal-dependent hydrolase
VIIDVNVHLSRWPFRRLPCDEISRMLERMDRWNVSSAWAGCFDGLFHRDLSGVNLRLTEACGAFGHGRLLPFGCINPQFPDWQEDLRRCHEDLKMPGIRLYPNYHGYTLDAPVFARLLAAAAERELIVQLAVRMDDDRVRHPLLSVDDVDVAPLAKVVEQSKGTRLVLVNGLRTLRRDALVELAAAGDVYFEISMLEGIGGIAHLLRSLPGERLLFGSHLPLFNLESAVFKVHESSLDPQQRAALLHENATRLLGNS